MVFRLEAGASRRWVPKRELGNQGIAARFISCKKQTGRPRSKGGPSLRGRVARRSLEVLLEFVVAGAAEELVDALAADEGVVAVLAEELVRALAAFEAVVAVAAVQLVVAGLAVEEVVAVAAGELVVAGPAVERDGLVAVEGADLVV